MPSTFHPNEECCFPPRPFLGPISSLRHAFPSGNPLWANPGPRRRELCSMGSECPLSAARFRTNRGIGLHLSLHTYIHGTPQVLASTFPARSSPSHAAAAPPFLRGKARETGWAGATRSLYRCSGPSLAQEVGLREKACSYVWAGIRNSKSEVGGRFNVYLLSIPSWVGCAFGPLE